MADKSAESATKVKWCEAHDCGFISVTLSDEPDGVDTCPKKAFAFPGWTEPCVYGYRWLLRDRPEKPRPFPPALLSVAKAGEILGVTPATAYKYVNHGDIPSINLGGRVYVPTAKLANMLSLDFWDLSDAND